MSIDWGVVGAAVMATVTGALGWISGRGKRRVADAESGANVELLQGLVTRVQSLETSLAGMSDKLDAEAGLRMQAQEEAHRLRLRVMTLETAMRQIGAVIPPEVDQQ